MESYRKKCEHSADDLVLRETEGHREFPLALITSLELAGDRVTEEVLKRETLSAQEMYRDLCVLQKQGWARI